MRCGKPYAGFVCDKIMKNTLLVIDMQEGAAKGRYHGNYLNRQWWDRHAGVVSNVLKLSSLAGETVFVCAANSQRINAAGL